jgi:tRNA(adenine34) deaminase
MSDKQYMEQTIAVAEKSPEPVGCGVLIVCNEKIIAKAYNSQRFDNMATHHAEIKAINQANKALGTRKMEKATAYCSCEPCAMCKGRTNCFQ